VSSVAVSADGKYLAACCGQACKDNYVRLFEFKKPELMFQLEGHTKSINCVVFSADAKELASTSNDSTVIIYCARMQNILYKLEGHKGNVYCAAYSPDG
jgi:WD40 repeat protein